MALTASSAANSPSFKSNSGKRTSSMASTALSALVGNARLTIDCAFNCAAVNVGY